MAAAAAAAAACINRLCRRRQYCDPLTRYYCSYQNNRRDLFATASARQRRRRRRDADCRISMTAIASTALHSVDRNSSVDGQLVLSLCVCVCGSGTRICFVLAETTERTNDGQLSGEDALRTAPARNALPPVAPIRKYHPE